MHLIRSGVQKYLAPSISGPKCGAWYFEIVERFLENLCTPELGLYIAFYYYVLT
jgi:hypothetical protein